MPSPLAHVGVALATRALLPGDRPLRDRLAGACVIASLLPDADMLLVVLLPGGITWHHGASHSLLVAATLGVVTALGFGLRSAPALAMVALCGVEHVFLDALTGDPSEATRFGVPWLWPFTEAKVIAPWPIFVPFGIDREGFLWHMVSAEAMRAYGREVLVVAGAWAGPLVVRCLRMRVG